MAGRPRAPASELKCVRNSSIGPEYGEGRWEAWGCLRLRVMNILWWEEFIKSDKKWKKGTQAGAWVRAAEMV
jgi:hypothetical protein